MCFCVWPPEVGKNLGILIQGSYLEAGPHLNQPRSMTPEPLVHSRHRKITQPLPSVTVITRSISYTLIVPACALAESLFYRTFLAKQYHDSQKEFSKKEMILVFTKRCELKIHF